MKALGGLLELEEAVEHILRTLDPLPVESLPLPQAMGRFLATSLAAPGDLPGFDNSAMDGYAVRAADVAGATASQPVPLRLCGQVAAGELPASSVEPGACARVFTGSALPPGADAVVMQEDTRGQSSGSGRMPEPRPGPGATVLVLAPVAGGENVRRRGEDVRAGSPLCRAGEELTPGRAGLLAALGVREVAVHRAPTVALMATGNELAEPDQPLRPGQVYESNRVCLAPLMARSGGCPRVWPLVQDDLRATQTALEGAFEQCDAVVTTGGVSVGAFDFVKVAFEQMGGALDFWRVAMRPGRPFVFGRHGRKRLFGLPGNPVSAFVTFLLLVRPALLKWQGAAQVHLPAHPGMLVEPLNNLGERRHFLRVTVDERGRIRSAGPQASHVLSGLAAANGLLDMPAGARWAAGTSVQVLRWDVR